MVWVSISGLAWHSGGGWHMWAASLGPPSTCGGLGLAAQGVASTLRGGCGRMWAAILWAVLTWHRGGGMHMLAILLGSPSTLISLVLVWGWVGGVGVSSYVGHGGSSFWLGCLLSSVSSSSWGSYNCSKHSACHASNVKGTPTYFAVEMIFM